MKFEAIKKRAKGYLTDPTKTFARDRKTSFGDAFSYVLILGIFFAVLTGLVSAIWVGPFGIFMIVVTYVALVVGLLISGLWLHLWAWIFGARKGLEQTMKVAFFSTTPTLLFGWIPIIGGIFGLWAIVLQVLGLKELQKMSTGNAVLAIVIPLILVLVIVAVLFVAFFGLILASMVGGGSFDPNQFLVPTGLQ